MISANWNTASVIAGSTRCFQPSNVSQPVDQPPSITTSPRPKLGNNLSITANTRISRMPIRNVGSDTPSSDNVMNTCEPKRPRRNAVYTPNGMPTTSAITAADSASSIVAGKRSTISEDTLRPWRRLKPNSPRTALPTKRANCTTKEASRPRSARNCCRCSGVAS